MTTHTNPDTPAEQTAPTLMQNAIYTRNAFNYIAVSETELELLGDAGHHRVKAEPGDELHSLPGSPTWIARMTHLRDGLLADKADLIRRFEDQHNRAREMETRYADLGQALLEEAESRGWCSEYDDFAAEWNLPPRVREYEVTMTITVKATSEEDAEEIVGACVSIPFHEDWYESDPSFDAREA